MTQHRLGTGLSVELAVHRDDATLQSDERRAQSFADPATAEGGSANRHKARTIETRFVVAILTLVPLRKGDTVELKLSEGECHDGQRSSLCAERLALAPPAVVRIAGLQALPGRLLGGVAGPQSRHCG